MSFSIFCVCVCVCVSVCSFDVMRLIKASTFYNLSLLSQFATVAVEKSFKRLRVSVLQKLTFLSETGAIRTAPELILGWKGL